jgi:hypothetical protein
VEHTARKKTEFLYDIDIILSLPGHKICVTGHVSLLTVIMKKRLKFEAELE